MNSTTMFKNITTAVIATLFFSCFSSVPANAKQIVRAKITTPEHIETAYSTIEEALDNMHDGDTLTALADYQGDITVASAQKWILDFDTYTYTGTLNILGECEILSGTYGSLAPNDATTIINSKSLVISGGIYLYTVFEGISEFVPDSHIVLKNNDYYTVYSQSADRIELATESYTYDGKAKKPAITVYDSHNYVIPASYYSTTWYNNTNIGKATATVTMKNGFTGTLSSCFTIIPATSKITSISNTDNGMLIKWSKSNKATGYEIYRRSNSSGFQKIATLKKASTQSYLDTGLINGISYTYKVVAYKIIKSATYYSNYSNQLPGVRLSTPKLLTLKKKNSKTLIIKWSKNPKASGYEISYATNKSFKGAKVKKVSSGQKTSLTLKNLKRKKYYVRVRAYKKVGNKIYYSAFL